MLAGATVGWFGCHLRFRLLYTDISSIYGQKKPKILLIVELKLLQTVSKNIKMISRSLLQILIKVLCVPPPKSSYS